MTDRPKEKGTAVILTCDSRERAWLAAWCDERALARQCVQDPDAVVARALRSRPRIIVLDASGDTLWTESVFSLCARLKRDAFSGVVPLLVLCEAAHFGAAFGAGADEVIRSADSDDEARTRISAMLLRSDRDLDVHPSTRLSGTREIGSELQRRIDEREMFAVCYADLDHFKEFNDRYSYARGNEVIQLLALLLHDIVKGLCGEQGFIGHIGGDDFLFVVPLAAMPRVCDEVIKVFDELMPLQYSESDRSAGYFFGKDRRGQLHRVPLMTLSVGVVTNQRRRFRTAREVSELATEMKTYAKTLAGSVWAVDRRRDDDLQVKLEKLSPGAGGDRSMSAKTGGAR